MLQLQLPSARQVSCYAPQCHQHQSSAVRPQLVSTRLQLARQSLRHAGMVDPFRIRRKHAHVSMAKRLMHTLRRPYKFIASVFLQERPVQ